LRGSTGAALARITSADHRELALGIRRWVPKSHEGHAESQLPGTPMPGATGPAR